MGKQRKEVLGLVIVLCAFCMCGCGKLEYDMPYSTNSQVSAYNVVSTQYSEKLDPFASGLCVVAENVTSTRAF